MHIHLALLLQGDYSTALFRRQPLIWDTVELARVQREPYHRNARAAVGENFRRIKATFLVAIYFRD